MSITLGGISLPDLTKDGEFSQQQVRAVVEFSLGGTPNIWEDLKYGKSIDLIGTSDTGWIDRQTLLDLQALVGVPLVSYSLDYEGELKTVRFRHEDQPVIEADPIIPRPNHVTTDYYNNVRIKLMEV